MASSFSFPVESEQMLHALRGKQEEAFASLFKTYYPLLLNYGGRILQDTEQANDVVQETFCHLFENSDRLMITSLKAYLYKAVYHRCLDLLRHRKVRMEYVTAEMRDFYFSHVIQDSESEVRLRSQELSVAIKEAIEGLPERCREIFKMSKLEDLSNKQIAEQLGISVKTVENHMTTAYSRLRKELEWVLIIFIIYLFLGGE